MIRILIEQYKKGQIDVEDLAWEATKQGYKTIPQQDRTIFYKGDKVAFIVSNDGCVETNKDVI